MGFHVVPLGGKRVCSKCQKKSGRYLLNGKENYVIEYLDVR